MKLTMCPTVLLLLLALTGCATDPAMLARARRPVYCVGGGDCEVKWSRAVQWVKQNSDYKFDQVSDMLISTKGPSPDDPSPAFTITKIAQGNGRYNIDFSAGCDNIIGCVPSIVEEQAEFGDFVMGRK